MRPSSCKAKGRALQHWVRDRLLAAFPTLQPDDVRSTSMGASGEDVQLSPAARACFPFQVECKNRVSFSIYQQYAQACSHGKHEPVLVIKQNRSNPLVVMDFEAFLKLIAK